MDIYLSNTLTRKKEKFLPNTPGKVGVYSCGPTVYWNQHIGHMYAYVQWDVLVRFLRFTGLDVKWVMNVTDVGHMTSDEDAGEDKMEKGAKREGVSVWEVADKYIAQFKDSMALLGIASPDVVCRATDNIEEQIQLNQLIEKNGFAYLTTKGLVYDTSKFADYAKFANLNLDDMRKRDDVEVDPDKKLPWDFFLWAINDKHLMKWPSPWGEGYPGWHIECTAMSTKYLGQNFDIHTGGIEHVGVHHTNEIAQGYAAFGKQTANYWLHNGWLMGKSGEKMSKSLGNFVTAQELVEKGYNPLALRYLILTSHYKKGLNFSWASLDSAGSALSNLKSQVASLKSENARTALSEEKEGKIDDYRNRFTLALSDDINIPQALAVTWEVLKSNIPSPDKLDLVLSFDQVLGLNLLATSKLPLMPQKVKALQEKREKLRSEGKFDEADKLRDEIQELGFVVSDKKMM